jgi:hypothetical protein
MIGYVRKSPTFAAVKPFMVRVSDSRIELILFVSVVGETGSRYGISGEYIE